MLHSYSREIVMWLRLHTNKKSPSDLISSDFEKSDSKLLRFEALYHVNEQGSSHFNSEKGRVRTHVTIGH